MPTRNEPEPGPPINSLGEETSPRSDSSVDGESLPRPSGIHFDPPSEPGEVGTLGPYRIVKELGRGGMGSVYAAVDTRLNRRVAFKVMLPRYAKEPAARERFLREARAVAQITHDNVVTVYEADERSGVPYIAMQYLEGYALDQFLNRKGSPTLPQILRIAHETAAGLAAAHAIGLVHRDIKPANLWLEAPEGRVKVLDFGLARPFDSQVELTRSGVVVGTPAYMSPEQARGEKVDPRTDLFSLGAVLYRLCTGRLPFEGSTTMAVLMALGTEEPRPVLSLNPTVPPALAHLIHQLLSKNPVQRPGSAQEVVDRIKVIQQGSAGQGIHGVPIVYAPMAITAMPANPFADLDPVERSDSASPPAKEGRWGLWPIAIGAVVLSVLLLGGVVAIINRKSDSSEKVEQVEPSGVKEQKDTAKAITRPKTVDQSPARRAAEWVLAQQGKVRVNEATGWISEVATLPNGRFNLTGIDLTERSIVDADLARLKEMTEISTPLLAGTPISDPGLVHLKDMALLKELNLSHTRVAGPGLVHLADCRQLSILNLSHSSLTDDGIAPIKDLTSLTGLTLNDTKITDAGLQHLGPLKKLSELSLMNLAVTDRGLAALAGLVRLHSIDLSNTKVIGTGLVHVSSARSLQLNQCPLTDLGLSSLRSLAAIENLSLDDTSISDAGLVHAKECTKLSSLHLIRTRVKGACFAEFGKLKSMRSLAMVGTPLDQSSLVDLKAFPLLSDVDVSETGLSDEGLKSFAICISLTRLSLLKTKIAKSSLVALQQSLPRCEIRCDEGIIPAIDVDRVFAEKVLTHKGSLRIKGGQNYIKMLDQLPRDQFVLSDVSFFVESRKFGDDDLAPLRWLPSIEVIALSQTGITDAGLVHLQRLTALRELNLSGTKVSDRGLVALNGFEYLGNLSLQGTSVTGVGLKDMTACNRLTSLILAHSPVTDATLAQIPSFPNLRSIDLSRTDVTEAGLVHLKKQPSLTQLRIDLFPLTDQGLLRLARDIPKLQTLSIRSSRVTDKGLAEFHAAMPGCRVTHDRGVIEPKK